MTATVLHYKRKHTVQQFTKHLVGGRRFVIRAHGHRTMWHIYNQECWIYLQLQLQGHGRHGRPGGIPPLFGLWKPWCRPGMNFKKIWANIWGIIGYQISKTGQLPLSISSWDMKGSQNLRWRCGYAHAHAPRSEKKFNTVEALNHSYSRTKFQLCNSSTSWDMESSISHWFNITGPQNCFFGVLNVVGVNISNLSSL